jgi:hypothetical protein
MLPLLLYWHLFSLSQVSGEFDAALVKRSASRMRSTAAAGLTFAASMRIYGWRFGKSEARLI